jgi:hypothetical protein
MKKRMQVVILALLVGLASLSGQAVKSFFQLGGSGTVSSSYAITDQNNNIYIVGLFKGTISYGSNSLTSYGTGSTYDIFLLSLDENFAFRWMKQVGTTTAEGLGSNPITIVGENLFLVGYFSGGPCTFSATVSLNSTGSYDGYIAKYALDGNLVAARAIAYGYSDQRVYGIKGDSNDNLVVIGTYKNSIQFNSSDSLYSSTSYKQAFIAKFDASDNLNYLNGIKIENNNTNSLCQVAVLNTDASGYYFGGYYAGNMYFDLTTLSGERTDSTDIFIYKTNSNLEGQWIRTMHGSSSDMPKALVVSGENIYMNGQFESHTLTVDSTASLTTRISNANSTNTADIFTALYNTSGNLQWIKSYGGVAKDNAYGAYAGSNFVMVASSIAGPVTINGVTYTPTLSDMFGVVYSNEGNVSLIKRIGGTGVDLFKSAIADSKGDLIFIGDFASTSLVAEGTTFTKSGGDDMLAIKYDNMFIDTVVTNPACNNQNSGSINITVKGTGLAPYTYKWAKSGDASFSRTSEDLLNVGAGTYYLTITDANSDSLVISSIQLTNPSGPSVTLTSSDSDNAFCVGTSITFTATEGLSNYQFRVDGTTVQNGSLNSYTTSSLTNGQSVDVVVTDSTNACATSTAIVNTVQVLPVVSFSEVPDVCENATSFALIQGTPTGGTYSGTGISTSPTFDPSVSGAGTFTLTYLYTDANNCSNTATQNIVVNSSTNVSVSITSNNSTICQGSAVTFTAVPVNGGTSPVYQWKVNGISVGTNSNTYSYTPSDGDSVTCELTSSLSCPNPSIAVSNLIKIIISGAAPVITSQPVSTYICENATGSFIIGATGTGLTYQWQVFNNSVWANVVDDATIYSGATNDTLTITNPLYSMNTYRYRCTVSGTCSPSITSTIRYLYVRQVPQITVQPANPSTICAVNGSTSLTVVATGTSVTYYWQVSANNGSTWATLSDNTYYSGTRTTTLTVTNPPYSYNNYLYRCQVHGTCTPYVNSDSVILTLTKNPTISTQPANLAVCENATGMIRVIATGGGLTYQWEQYNGTSWSTISNGDHFTGATKDTLYVINPDSAWTGYKYRCLVSGTCSPAVYTNGSATLTVKTVPDITLQPVSTGGFCALAGTAIFTVAATTNPAYYWQVSTNGGTTWSYVSTTSTYYSGASTNTLSVVNPPGTYNNYHYRCQVRGICTPYVYSDGTAILSVIPSPVIVRQPANVSVCTSSTGRITIGATGDGLSFAWEVSTDAGSNWSAITDGAYYTGTNNDTLYIVSPSASMSGYRYRCVVSGSCSPSVTSNGSATLTVNETPSITGQPVGNSEAFCALNGSATFTVAASGTNLTYYWQVSANSGTSWSYVYDNGYYSGSRTTTLTVTNPPRTYNNYRYRCQVRGTCTPYAYSDGTAVLSLLLTPVITYQPRSASICYNSSGRFIVKATGEGDLSYSWEVSADSGSTWNPISDGGSYLGTTNDTLIVSYPDAGMSGYRYRCTVEGSCSPAVTSNGAAILTVNQSPYITLQPISPVAACASNGSSTFVVGAAGGTNLTYYWQISTKGISWSTLSDNTIYTGARNDTLVVTNAPIAYNNYYYRCQVRGCTPYAYSGSAQLPLNASSTVSASMSVDQNNVTEGTEVLFTASPVNGGSSPAYQWYVNSSGVGTSANTYNYVPVNSDTVWVVLTSSISCPLGNPAKSNSILMVVNAAKSAINKQEVDSTAVTMDAVSYYPNPVSSTLYIDLLEFGRGSECAVELINMTGKTIFTKRINRSIDNNSLIQADLSRFPSGIYFLKVSSGSKLINKRIVKQ